MLQVLQVLRGVLIVSLLAGVTPDTHTRAHLQAMHVLQLLQAVQLQQAMCRLSRRHCCAALRTHTHAKGVFDSVSIWTFVLIKPVK